MLADKKPRNCEGCYLQEKGRSDLNSISSRLYYLKEVGSKTKLDIYDNKENFSLKHVDLRWTNSCNQACVYCCPELSSKWAQELNVKIKSKKESREDVKNFVFENIENLQNVYLAGGEPMLMKENLEFLQLLKEKNHKCSIRVNTNLSTTKTGIFDLLCTFPNVHWTVSLETIEHEYEYIRHHGSWDDFQKNLEVINTLDHKISFNMLHFILNYDSLFGCIDYLKAMGFNDNSFIVGPLYMPENMNLLNLPQRMLDQVLHTLRDRIADKPTGYLKNSYENLLAYYTDTQWKKDIQNFLKETEIRDQRRGTDCRKTFPKLFQDLNADTLE
jgi:MoaA/NifB/PqqE/SkfB family radical SAM enzyme